jgi:hypothetical protein
MFLGVLSVSVMCECDVFVCVRYPAPEHNHFSADKQNQLRISATPNLCTPPRSHARHRRLGRLVVWRLCGRRAALRRAVRHRVPRPVAPAGAARVRQGVHAQVPQFQAGQGGDQVRQQVSGCATVDEMKTSRHTQVDLNGFHCPPPMMIVPLVPFFPCFFFFFFFTFLSLVAGSPHLGRSFVFPALFIMTADARESIKRFRSKNPF